MTRHRTVRLLLAVAVGLLASTATATATAAPATDAPRWVVVEDGLGENPGDYATAVAVGPRAGDVYVLGALQRATTGAFVQLSAYTRDGATRWVRPYVATDRAEAQPDDLVIHPRAGTVVALLTVDDAAGDYAPVVVAYDERGRWQWETRLQPAEGIVASGRELVLDPVAGLVYVQSLSVAGVFDSSMTTTALDLSGRVVWSREVRGPAETSFVPRGIDVDATRGTVAVTGFRGRDDGAVTVLYDVAGTELWRRTEPEARLAAVTDAAVDEGTGAVYVTGYVPDETGPSSVVTIAYGGDGTRRWIRRDDAPATEGNLDATLAVVPGSGTLVVASTPASSASGGTVAVLTRAYSPAGRPLWRATLDRPTRQAVSTLPLAVDVDPIRRTVHVATSVATGAESSRFALVSYDQRGERLREESYLSGDDGVPNELADLAVDPTTGHVYLTGTTELVDDVDDDSDWLTLAYPPAS